MLRLDNMMKNFYTHTPFKFLVYNAQKLFLVFIFFELFILGIISVIPTGLSLKKLYRLDPI